jgi:DNA repair protein RecO (recombination protein O)
MADQTVNAIVLRRERAGENDRRVILLTQELGKIDAYAKGAAKGTSRLSAVTEPMCASVMTLATGRTGKSRYITQAQPLFSFPGLRGDYDRLHFGLALTELAAAVLPWQAQFPHYFERLAAALAAIEHHEKPVVGLCWGLVRLLEAAGLLPDFDKCVETGRPIRESVGYLSPQAGGYVCEERSVAYTDRYRVRAEALIGLQRLAALERPPGNLKFAEECLRALYPLCVSAAEAPLPALAAVYESLHEQSMSE